MIRLLVIVLAATAPIACSKSASAPANTMVTMPSVRHAVTHAQELDGHGCMYLGCVYERSSSTGFEQEPCACDERLVGAPVTTNVVSRSAGKTTLDVTNQSTERIRLVGIANETVRFDDSDEGELQPGATRRIEIKTATQSAFRAEKWCWHQEGQCYELKRPTPEEHASR